MTSPATTPRTSITSPRVTASPTAAPEDLTSRLPTIHAPPERWLLRLPEGVIATIGKHLFNSAPWSTEHPGDHNELGYAIATMLVTCKEAVQFSATLPKALAHEPELKVHAWRQWSCAAAHFEIAANRSNFDGLKSALRQVQTQSPNASLPLAWFKAPGQGQAILEDRQLLAQLPSIQLELNQADLLGPLQTALKRQAEDLQVGARSNFSITLTDDAYPSNGWQLMSLIRDAGWHGKATIRLKNSIQYSTEIQTDLLENNEVEQAGLTVRGSTRINISRIAQALSKATALKILTLDCLSLEDLNRLLNALNAPELESLTVRHNLFDSRVPSEALIQLVKTHPHLKRLEIVTTGKASALTHDDRKTLERFHQAVEERAGDFEAFAPDAFFLD